MTEHPLIPQEKTEAVTRALREAFGVTEFEDIRALTGGNTTSRVFRIVVQGSPFVLKTIMRKDDATRNYTNMRAAAEAGLAPLVRYTSMEDKVSITDFVDVVPLPVTDALVRIPATLRDLHALPPFAGVPDPINTSCMFLINKGPALDGFIQTFHASNTLPQRETEELLACHARLAAAYRRDDSDMVSSHNDFFKPDNILFDGRRVWLIDWEAAFLNDRYADLAVLANLVVTNNAEEKVFLQRYFGQPPNPYQRARFFHMQQVAHAFYAMAFLWMGSAGKPVELSEPVPEFNDFHRRLWAGELNVADNAGKLMYGRVHYNRLLHNLRQPRFEGALEIVAGSRASA